MGGRHYHLLQTMKVGTIKEKRKGEKSYLDSKYKNVNRNYKGRGLFEDGKRLVASINSGIPVIPESSCTRRKRRFGMTYGIWQMLCCHVAITSWQQFLQCPCSSTAICMATPPGAVRTISVNTVCCYIILICMILGQHVMRSFRFLTQQKRHVALIVVII